MHGGFHIGRSGIGIRTRQDWGLELEELLKTQNQQGIIIRV